MANQREVQASQAPRRPAYHARKRSGHGIPSRPSMVTRKSTNGQKLLVRQREHTEYADNANDEEEEGESFPQYCMTCEKEFIPHDVSHLYCSPACRELDASSTWPTESSRNRQPYADHLSVYSTSSPSTRDIIPRASPSRPLPMQISPPTSPNPHSAYYHTSSTNYPSSDYLSKSYLPSPSSPTHTAGGIWPFSQSLSNSYYQSSSNFMPATYDAAYNSHYTTGRASPLPSRQPPNTYSRPKSIELVTPILL